MFAEMDERAEREAANDSREVDTKGQHEGQHSNKPAKTPKVASRRPLVERYFTTAGRDPFEDIEWVKVDARIPSAEPNRPPVFEQRDVEAPSFWSQTAVNIAAEKYFAGHLGTPERETSVRQMIERVVLKIANEGERHGYFQDAEEKQTFIDELKYLLVHQYAAFNSPVWFNIGVEGVPQQCSACFILSIEDSLLSITEWYRQEALIFQAGSGAGINLSPLRASCEPLSRGGYSSGPVTFMRAADASAGTITSGGRTRRAAKMVLLDVDHPDIEDFIWCKAIEERKVRVLAAHGYDFSLNTKEGERNWATIMYQNANNSVRVSDEFMQAVVEDREWPLRARVSGEVVRTVKARQLFSQIAAAAWECADPGLQFADTINSWHTTPANGPINASNPCLAGDTKVLTIDGFVAIKDLANLRQQVTFNINGQQKWGSVWKTGRKQCVRIVTALGDELVVTPDHLLRLANGVWEEAQNLKGQDLLVLVPQPRVKELKDDYVRQDLIERGSAWATSKTIRDDIDRYPLEWLLPFVFGAIQVLPHRISKEKRSALRRALYRLGVLATIDNNGNIVAEDNYRDRLAAIRGGALSLPLAPTTWSSVRVTDVLPDKERTVYDFHVPLENQAVVGCGVLAHNCSEYLHVDDSSCNLASLNLLKFRREDGTFDTEAFRHAVRVLFTAQDILIAFADYPTEKIAKNTRELRQIGLGYANLGAYLMSCGLPYDSQDGRNVAAAITALMNAEAYCQSARLAAAVGPYAHWDANRDSHLNVLRRHAREARRLRSWHKDRALTAEAKAVSEEMLELAERHGVRNAQATVIAPTGTISFLMDCDTTGIEPDFALVKTKRLVGGGEMTLVNRSVPLALKTLGYSEEKVQEICEHILGGGSLHDCPHLAPQHRDVFATAVGENPISPDGHLLMVAAIQPFLSGTASKTINLPATATVEDIERTYMRAWELGIKAISVYRDGCKVTQPLASGADDSSEGAEDASSDSGRRGGLGRGVRRVPPSEGQALKKRFEIYSPRMGKVSGHILVSLFQDGTPAEVFVHVAQAGSPLRGWMDTWSRCFSLALQYGTPLDVLVAKHAFASFEPAGRTNDPAISNAHSIPDYVVRWLALKFLDPSIHQTLGIATPDGEQREAEDDSRIADEDIHPRVEVRANVLPAKESVNQPVLGSCSLCGGMLVQTGRCATCTSCGNTGGCG